MAAHWRSSKVKGFAVLNYVSEQTIHPHEGRMKGAASRHNLALLKKLYAFLKEAKYRCKLFSSLQDGSSHIVGSLF
jgi:hypothetical protein